MSRRVILALFLATCAAQWITASWLITERELTLRRGAVFRLKTVPVDPVDAFHGRYVAVRVKEDSVPFDGPWEARRWMFAELAVGEDGFARFVRLHDRCPEDVPSIRTRLASFCDTKKQARLDLPLDRFYMDERLAPAAERAYREHSQTNAQEVAWLAVRVWRGRAAIENLYIGNRPIRDVVQPSAIPQKK